MNFCLVADDGEAQVVVGECDVLRDMRLNAEVCSSDGVLVRSTCKFHVCRREPSANGTHRVVIETWEKGVKL